jgi:ABC-type nitrate/sulfonate/bicarbonate transport system ATPase subunit
MATRDSPLTIAAEGAPPAGADAAVDLRRVTKRFRSRAGQDLLVLDDISFRVRDNEFVCLLGPSGCGKSTLLRLLADLEPPSGGAMFIHGRPHREVAQRVGFVFQEDALLPWRTVVDNVGLGLEARGVSKRERRERARAIMQVVGLAGFEDYFVHQLSGGMRQRAAVARALLIDPEVLLMDEPFASVDVLMKTRLHAELARIWQAHQTTVLFVTHDVEEAVYLADTIVVMTPRPGRLKRVVSLDLVRPRDRLSPAFVDVRREIQELFSEIEADRPGGHPKGVVE